METCHINDALVAFERHNELVQSLLTAFVEAKGQLSAEQSARKQLSEENERLCELIRVDKASLAEMQTAIAATEKQLSDIQALHSDAIKISLKARISEDRMPHIQAEVILQCRYSLCVSSFIFRDTNTKYRTKSWNPSWSWQSKHFCPKVWNLSSTKANSEQENNLSKCMVHFPPIEISC